MHVFVCACARAFVRALVRAYVLLCMQALVRAFARACICASMYFRMGAFAHACFCASILLHVRAFARACFCTCVELRFHPCICACVHLRVQACTLTIMKIDAAESIFFSRNTRIKRRIQNGFRSSENFFSLFLVVWFFLMMPFERRQELPNDHFYRRFLFQFLPTS